MSYEELKLEEWMPEPQATEYKKMYICPVCEKRFPKNGYKKHWDVMKSGHANDYERHKEYALKK